MTAVRLPRNAREQIEQTAARTGAPMSDVAAMLICQALGLPAPPWCQPTDPGQTELPIARAS